jgi:phosphoribosylformylglycinamidine cyclo-ligase
MAENEFNTGVDYGSLDAYKVLRQIGGRRTAGNLARFGMREVPETRGESVYLIEDLDANRYFGITIEGLGTKNIVADEVGELLGWGYYAAAAQDCAAMIFNDMITLGVAPMTLHQHAAVAEGAWFNNPERTEALATGWTDACEEAGCVDASGETPELRGLVMPGRLELSGSGWGMIRPKEKRFTGDIQDGDAIIMLGSSGIHANGLTNARKVGDKVGYDYDLGDQSFAEALLRPTFLYVRVILELQARNIPVRYGVNITGHGLRKLMRLPQNFVYYLDDLPEPQPEFKLIQEVLHDSDRSMYASYNMGNGFALFVPNEFAEATRLAAIDVSQEHMNGEMGAWRAGTIEKRGEEKKVVIGHQVTGKTIVYEGETLGGLRA